MKTRKSPRWYYELRAATVALLLLATLITVGYLAISWVSDYHANYYNNHRIN